MRLEWWTDDRIYMEVKIFYFILFQILIMAKVGQAEILKRFKKVDFKTL